MCKRYSSKSSLDFRVLETEPERVILYYAGDDYSLHIISDEHPLIFLIGVGPIILGGHKQTREDSKTSRSFVNKKFYDRTRDAFQKSWLRISTLRGGGGGALPI